MKDSKKIEFLYRSIVEGYLREEALREQIEALKTESASLNDRLKVEASLGLGMRKRIDEIEPENKKDLTRLNRDRQLEAFEVVNHIVRDRLEEIYVTDWERVLFELKMKCKSLSSSTL